jgi:hypothetical protein
MEKSPRDASVTVNLTYDGAGEEPARPGALKPVCDKILNSKQEYSYFTFDLLVNTGCKIFLGERPAVLKVKLLQNDSEKSVCSAFLLFSFT